VAYRGVLEDIRKCINLGIPERVPVFALGELFNVRMAGITYREYTDNVSKMAKCEVDAVKKFDYDWVYLNPDDYIEFEPLGIKTKGEENIPLAAYEYLPASIDRIKNLKFPNPQKDGRMPAFLEAVSRIKKELGDSVCVTGRVAAPFTSVSLLFGVEKALTLPYENNELLLKSMDFLLELAVEWAKAQIRAGADAIWVGDCIACSGFVSSKHYNEFALSGALKINEILKKESFVFYHAGESSLQHLELMADSHPDVLSIGGKIDIGIAKETVGKRVCLMGNIRGMEVVQREVPENVEKETIRIMETGKKNGGYIFNSEEGIPCETPEENMRIMMQAAKKHSQYNQEEKSAT